ncbi:unnamed protein product [Phytomonas sp. Hart1]|nr:unnamed protein product [Phytomonas sp. Hart1]|eukprot:CCW71814.1 unnamed protein product [Phytomonas sp. isolate Hart1]
MRRPPPSPTAAGRSAATWPSLTSSSACEKWRSSSRTTRPCRTAACRSSAKASCSSGCSAGSSCTPSCCPPWPTAATPSSSPPTTCAS